MIAGSDRVVPRFRDASGDEVRVPPHSGSTAPTIAPALQVVGALRQSRRF